MSSRPPLRPITPLRTLPVVLREALGDRSAVRLTVGVVMSIPDTEHVVVQIAEPAEDADAVTINVAKLRSYSPTVGEPVYLLVSGYWSLAIGTV